MDIHGYDGGAVSYCLLYVCELNVCFYNKRTEHVYTIITLTAVEFKEYALFESFNAEMNVNELTESH